MKLNTIDPETESRLKVLTVPVMEMVGADGNAFAIMGRFKSAARKAGWTDDDANRVIKEMQSGNYDHLLAVMLHFADEPEGDYEDEEDDEDD